MYKKKYQMANRNLCLVRLLIITIYITISTNFLMATSLIPKEKDGLWGFVDDKGKWKIEPQYHHVGNFSNELAPVMKYYNHNGAILQLWGYINSKGKIAIPLKYSYASKFMNGIAFVGNLPGTHWEPEPKWNEASTTTNLLQMCFINKTGNEAMFEKSRFHYAEFEEDSIKVLQNVFSSSQTSYRDRRDRVRARTSRYILNYKVAYEDLLRGFSDSSMIVSPQINASYESKYIKCIDSINNLPKELFRREGANILHIASNKLLDVITEELTECVDSIIPKTNFGMWGFVNSQGEWTIPAKYDYTERRKGYEWEASPLRKKYISSLHYVHGIDGWGAIDTQGNIFIPPVYDSIEKFPGSNIKGTPFLVHKNGSQGLINEYGIVTLNPDRARTHLHIFPQINRIIYANNETGAVIADSTGNIICEIHKPVHWTMINDKAIETGKWGDSGAVNWIGEEIVPHEYVYIYFEESFIRVESKSHLQGAYSYAGKNIIPVAFPKIESVGLLIGVKKDASKKLHMYDAYGKPIIFQEKNLVVHEYGTDYWSPIFFSLRTDDGYILCFDKGSTISRYLYFDVEWCRDKKELTVKRFDKNKNIIVEVYDRYGSKIG